MFVRSYLSLCVRFDLPSTILSSTAGLRKASLASRQNVFLIGGSYSDNHFVIFPEFDIKVSIEARRSREVLTFEDEYISARYFLHN